MPLIRRHFSGPLRQSKGAESQTYKASKTDLFRVGIDIYIGRTKDNLCPVAAVLAYLVRKGQGPGPLFKFEAGKPLTRARLVTEVK